MISCILAFYIAVPGPPAVPGHPPGAPSRAHAAAQDENADALYAKREDLDSARRAERVWQSRLSGNPQDFESAWKLARARYWIGGRTGADARQVLEAGIAA